MKVMIGSARIDERGRTSGGKAGDQKQSQSPDYKGEVSIQEFYVHKKGWYVLRPKSADIAARIADAMKRACDNECVGYNQARRSDIWKKGTASDMPTECDCSSLVRQCVKEAAGKDPGNFTTLNEADVLEKSDLFEKRKAYRSGFSLKRGDVLITKETGHTVVVTSISEEDTEKTTETYKQYTGNSLSIVDALKNVGEKNTSFQHRTEIARANGIAGYIGAIAQNIEMLEKLKKGTLIKA